MREAPLLDDGLDARVIIVARALLLQVLQKGFHLVSVITVSLSFVCSCLFLYGREVTCK